MTMKYKRVFKHEDAYLGHCILEDKFYVYFMQNAYNLVCHKYAYGKFTHNIQRIENLDAINYEIVFPRVSI